MPRDRSAAPLTWRRLLRPGAVVPVAADAYDDDGAGVGPGPHGVRVHAEGLLAGEQGPVRLQHVSPHRPEAWGVATAVDRASADRVRAPGEAGHRCGGCPWLDLAYAAQLGAKGESLAAALATLPAAAVPPVAPVVPSPRTVGYRNRAKLVAAARQGRLVLGAYRPRSHAVVDSVDCPVHEPAVIAAARAAAEVLADARIAPYDEATGRGLLRYVGVRASATDETLITLVAADAVGPWADLAAALAARLPGLRGVTLDVNPAAGNAIFGGDERPVRGDADLAEAYGPVAVRLTGAAFGQVNRDQAAALYAAAARAALAPLQGGAPPVAVWDLFTGAGALALTVSQAAGPGGPALLGIERDAAAVARARAAAAAQGLGDRCAFAAGDANAALADPAAAPDVVIVNPPRTGCRPGLLAALAPGRVRRVIYVSCAPVTLARDLGALLDRGWRLAAVTPYDMLPQTPHLEVLAVLEA